MWPVTVTTRSYVFANWSASTPQPCRSLPRAGGNEIPASVPTQAESAWNHPQFAPPLRTFFTVETGYDLRTIGSGTIAPGGVDVYSGGRHSELEEARCSRSA